MKILIVNTYDVQGGAARAAYRLHNSITDQGLDSKILVIDKESSDFKVLNQFDKKQKIYNKIQQVVINFTFKKYKNKTNTFFSNSWMPFSNFSDVVNEINPDILHLHWVSKGVLRIKDLQKINAPIVWSLHDMWAFTGGCHYDEHCGRFVKECGKCVVLGSQSEKDLSSKNYKQKKEVFSKLPNLTIIGLSKWLQESAKSSSLFRDKKVINLPNPIDTKKFKKFDKDKARELWGLPKNKKLVLFGAMSSTSDQRKGFFELSEALKNTNKKDFELVIFGTSTPEKPQDFGFNLHYMGTLSDNVSLVSLYNAVDVMVVPSLQENLSNTIMESLACGTPVVAFNIGGNKDMIDHKINGYLAKPFDVFDLAFGIEWVIYNESHETLQKNAINKVVKEFDTKVVGEKYIQLYESILKET